MVAITNLSHHSVHSLHLDLISKLFAKVFAVIVVADVFPYFLVVVGAMKSTVVRPHKWRRFVVLRSYDGEEESHLGALSFYVNCIRLKHLYVPRLHLVCGDIIKSAESLTNLRLI